MSSPFRDLEIGGSDGPFFQPELHRLDDEGLKEELERVFQRIPAESLQDYANRVYIQSVQLAQLYRSGYTPNDPNYRKRWRFSRTLDRVLRHGFDRKPEVAGDIYTLYGMIMTVGHIGSLTDGKLPSATLRGTARQRSVLYENEFQAQSLHPQQDLEKLVRAKRVS